MTELEALGARIASYRGDRSQRDLATETGLDVSTISRIERGATDPTFGTLNKIRKALKLTWEALIAGPLDRIVPDVVFKTGDGTEIVVEMKTLEAGRNPEGAMWEAESVRESIAGAAHMARLENYLKELPLEPAAYPPENFLNRPMSAEQASRLAALLKPEVEKCGLDTLEANVREFTDTIRYHEPGFGFTPREDDRAMSMLVRGDSQWVPQAGFLTRIADAIGIRGEQLEDALRNLGAYDGPFDAVLEAWEREVAIRQSPHAPATTPKPKRTSSKKPKSRVRPGSSSR
jgi:transcriptional regulator with XRE-family HTH domain